LVLLKEKGKILLSSQQVVIGDHKDTMVDPNTMVDPVLEIDYPHRALKNKGIVDSGCSRPMTGNKAYLAEFQDFNGGPVTFGEAEYVAAASCYGQNPVYHSKTKHIAIRHHFIRDAYEKKLIQVLKIHTNDNVADLLTKAFDGGNMNESSVDERGLKSKNSLMKHSEDMRLCRPSKEYLQVWFVPPRDMSMSCLTTKGMYTIGAVTKTYKNPSQSHTYSSNLSNLHSSLQALISLTDDLSLLSNMAALESCPKHNMIAYLEKTEGNVKFHEVIDFLRRSYIFHALTVSPVVSTTFVEQFWTSAKSKTINHVRHITAKVAGKSVSISEASIRTDLIFDDADGIDTLTNQAIFNAIQLMGYEGDLTVLTFNKALFSPQWRKFDREDLDKLWILVKETFSTTDPTEDKEKMLWVELKRLYEPDPRDQLWALQKYMHDPLEWKLYDTCGV
ncbi:hypothetical protein Tco_1145645, partial [Tanacetum coccineum]